MLTKQCRVLDKEVQACMAQLIAEWCVKSSKRVPVLSLSQTSSNQHQSFISSVVLHELELLN